MQLYSIYFKSGFKYMGIDLSQATVMVYTESFASLVNLIQKRLSKKNENALCAVTTVIELTTRKGWDEKMQEAITRATENPDSFNIAPWFSI